MKQDFPGVGVGVVLVLPQKPRLTGPNTSHPICPSSRVKCSPLRMWGGKAEWPVLLTNPVSPLPRASLTSEALLGSPSASEMFPKTPPFFCNTSLRCRSGGGPLLSYPLPGAPHTPPYGSDLQIIRLLLRSPQQTRSSWRARREFARFNQ